MKIGKIISVEFDKFRLRLFDSTKNSTVNIDGRIYYFGNIGSYLKTLNSAGEYVLCEVVSIVDFISKEQSPSITYNNFNLDSSREIIIKPIGTLIGVKFSMGVGIFPSLYSDVEIVTYDDLDHILSVAKERSKDSRIHSTISLGTSKSLINYKIDVDINQLFNIHTAILGNSGSGKSNTIAHILQEVYRCTDYAAIGAKTIIFDANGEYYKAFYDVKWQVDPNIQVRLYKPNIEEETDGYQPFILPYFLMNLDEWLSFLMASERTQKPFWDRVLQESYKFYCIFTKSESGEDLEKFANYIKWKLYLMLKNISTRVDSDTSKMTAAKGAINTIKEIVVREHKDKSSEDVFKDLMTFLDECSKLCFVNFGNNNDSLATALQKFVTNVDEEPSYVTITPKCGRGGVEGYEAHLGKEKDINMFKQIDETLALEVDAKKMKSGEFFDCEYIKIAAEMIVLEEESKGNIHIREFVSTLYSRLDYFLCSPECLFLREKANLKKQESYLSEVFNIGENADKENQLIIIDCSEVGTEALELMTSVVSRMILDYKRSQKGDNRQTRPVHLVLDEAHRYINKNTEYLLKENIYEKIAREGRKYALYLIVSSQRPSELSQTVLSQCGNYIVHRIQNEVDMKYIYSVLPYFSDDYISKIRQAVPGDALVFGNCVPMPLMVKISEPQPTPNSKNCDIRREWFQEKNA